MIVIFRVMAVFGVGWVCKYAPIWGLDECVRVRGYEDRMRVCVCVCVCVRARIHGLPMRGFCDSECVRVDEGVRIR